MTPKTPKNEAQIVPKKLTDIVRFTHEEINIDVKIDYINNKISLVESNYGSINNKKWLFADRWVEYMDSWLDILDAMKFAIWEAKRMYERELAKSSELTADELCRILDEQASKLQKQVKNKKPIVNLKWTTDDE